MERDRESARKISKEFIEKGDYKGWFEELYSKAEKSDVNIPWADMKPNPNLVKCLDDFDTYLINKNTNVLKIGCGLGDDAEELSRRGYRITGFDISKTAIKICNKRFPDSKVSYVTKDLFHPKKDWYSFFGLVIESYTLQVIPYEKRRKGGF